MNARLLLTLLSSRSLSRRHERGSALLIALIVVLTVVLGSVTLANRAVGGRLAAAFQGESREAREVAEAGIATVISEFNKPRNRKMLVANQAMSAWSTGNPSLRNPCSPDTPTATAVGFGANPNSTLVTGSGGSFSVVSIEVKNSDRTRRFLTTPTSSSATGSPAYNDGLVNLQDAGNVGYIAVTVRGTVRGASAVVTREFQVVPKCCNLSFGSGQSAHGNDGRICDASFPRILLGLNGGGFTSPGTAAQLRVLDASGNVTANKPSSVLCVTSAASCPGSRANANSVDGVPITRVGITPPPLPAYPGTQTNGATITSNSICETVGQIVTIVGSGNQTCTAAQVANGRDYMTVNASGQVQLCNTANRNTTAPGTNGEPVLVSGPGATTNTIVTGSCDSTINNFCVTTDAGTAAEAKHCRIRSLTVADDTRNDGETNRRQNNTFVIDSSRTPIYLYFNSAWSSTGITTVDNWDDGQIQHVRCTTPNDSSACGVKALPDDVPRVGLYSDRNTTVAVGDDGFVRDVFMYFPFGTLELRSDPDNSNNAFGMPNYRGAAWLNTLSMGANNSANSTQIAVPPASNTFFGLGNSANSPFSFLIYEWVARSTAATSLF